MKFKAGIYLIIFFAAILMSWSKRELNRTWRNMHTIKIKSAISSDSSVISDITFLSTYIYTGDSLIRQKRISFPADTINMPPGSYKFITINPAHTGVKYENMNNFRQARIIVDDNGMLNQFNRNISSIYSSTVSDYNVSVNKTNNLIVELSNQIKKIEYQLIIEGAKDSLEKCIIIQHGISNGFYLNDHTQIFDSVKVTTAYTEASSKNDFTGSFRLLGLNPDKKNLEIQFVYKNKTIQNSSLDLSLLEGDKIYSKKIIMYIDIKKVDIEFSATIKSWVLVEDKINL